MAPRRCILVIAELKEDFRRLIEHQRLIDRGVCEPEAHEPLAFEMRRRVVALMEAMFSSRSVPPGLLHPEVALRSPGTSREGEAEVSAYLAQTSKARAAAPPQSLRVVIRADHLLVTQHTAFVTVDFETEFVHSQCFFRVSTAAPSAPYCSIVRLPDDFDLSKPLPAMPGIVDIPSSSSSGAAPCSSSKKTRGGAAVTNDPPAPGGIRSIDATFDVSEFIEAVVREDAELRQHHAASRLAQRPESSGDSCGGLTTHASASPSLGIDYCDSPGGLDLMSDLMGLPQSKCPPYLCPSMVGDFGSLLPYEGARKRTRTSGADSACTSEAFSFGDNDELSGHTASSFLDEPFDRELLMCFSPLQGITGGGDAGGRQSASSEPFIGDPFLDEPPLRPYTHHHHHPSSSSAASSSYSSSYRRASPSPGVSSSWAREVTHTSEV